MGERELEASIKGSQSVCNRKKYLEVKVRPMRERSDLVSKVRDGFLEEGLPSYGHKNS